ncbi:MAG: FKBP-type peptidyl-prolyl cis-trans isomerase [Bacteroidales bacterium]|nr:FKBP-type peptidyl-prolyl cis-trans isomerase [Bacteroidales bacterium]
MMKQPFLLAVMAVLLLSCVACKNKQTTGVVQLPHQEEEEVYDPFVDGNRKIVALEDEEIDLFLKRYGWNTEKTGTGLRIEMVKEGSGGCPMAGQTVTLKYKTMLLSGDVVYSSDESGDLVFVVDKSNDVAGLHEAVKRMKKGAAARVVIPAHLAYGVGGDGDRIKGRKPIAMYLELIDIK